MIKRHEYMLGLKKRLSKLSHVTNVIMGDGLFIKMETESGFDFEIKMPYFNETRFMITFDCGVVGSNSCMGNMSFREFEEFWEDIYNTDVERELLYKEDEAE